MLEKMISGALHIRKSKRFSGSGQLLAPGQVDLFQGQFLGGIVK
jgi:hypothetical protein